MKRLFVALLLIACTVCIVYADIAPEPQQAGARVLKRLSRSISADSLRFRHTATGACTTITFDGAFEYASLNFVVSGETDSIDLNIVIDAMNAEGMWVPQDTVNVTTAGYHLEWLTRKLAAWNRIRTYGGTNNSYSTATIADSLFLLRKREMVQ